MNLSNLLGAVSMGALALAVAAVPAARAQEQLPVIDVGAARPTSGGGDAGQGFGAGAGTNNGTDIGPGNNGQICADGVCNNPTSYSAPIKSLGTKVNTPVMDTPLATKMVTHQMLEDQQAITLDQALRNVSGVYVSGGGGAALGVHSSASSFAALRRAPITATASGSTISAAPSPASAMSNSPMWRASKF